jgi:hypothetical protein
MLRCDYGEDDDDSDSKPQNKKKSEHSNHPIPHCCYEESSKKECIKKTRKFAPLTKKEREERRSLQAELEKQYQLLDKIMQDPEIVLQASDIIEQHCSVALRYKNKKMSKIN